MVRRLFNLLTALSLLLCVAACVLWVRSYRHLTAVVVWDGRALYGVSALRGGVRLARSPGPPPPGRPVRLIDVPLRGDVVYMDAAHGFAGFGYRWGDVAIVRLPFWALTLLLAAAPSVTLLRRLARHRRVRAGLCLRCGYDLRASPGRCPECGAGAYVTSSG